MNKLVANNLILAVLLTSSLVPARAQTSDSTLLTSPVTSSFTEERKSPQLAQAKGDDDKKDSGDKDKKAADKKAKKQKKPDDKGKQKQANTAGQDSSPKEDTESGDGKPVKAAKKKSDVPLPKRLASFTCGAVLGYPVAMAKRSVHQTKEGTRDFVGSTRNPLLLAPAVIISAPFGAVGGFLEGFEYSVMNSWKASKEEPFSKEAFSLDD